jgi:hypothetical protein
MTREEALLILNDHLGDDVDAVVTVVYGDLVTAVMNAHGSLIHWRADDDAAPWAGHLREDIIGLYQVEGANIDISELHHARPIEVDGRTRGLSFLLAGGDELSAELQVVWDPV